MDIDKPPTCPKCGETTLNPNEYHSGLKTEVKNISGTKFIIVYCSNCGAIVGVVKD